MLELIVALLQIVIGIRFMPKVHSFELTLFNLYLLAIMGCADNEYPNEERIRAAVVLHNHTPAEDDNFIVLDDNEVFEEEIVRVPFDDEGNMIRCK